MTSQAETGRLRVGIVCHPTHGGSGAVATELGLALGQRGHEVHLISYAAPFRLNGFQPNVVFHEVEIGQYPLFKYPPYILFLANKIAELIDSAELDIVHAHYAIPHSVSAYLARQSAARRGTKIITTLHGTDITLVGAEPSFFRVTRFAMDESDGITAVSEYLKKETEKNFHLRKPIRVIHNFVDTERFSAASCQREKLAGEGEAILTHVSNFRPVKRIRDVVEIFARVARTRPARLLLIGDGPELSGAVQHAEALGVKDRLSVLGLQDEVNGVIAASDLLLLPSEFESFGLVALEALSCGVPVIGTSSGGLPEVVTPGETGFLHDVGDVEGMARSALTILDDEALRSAMCENGRRVASERFRRDKIVDEYEAYYREILSS